MMKKEHLVLVDICGTLYDSNTTFDFLAFHCQTHAYRRFRSVTRTIPWRLFNRLLVGCFGWDLTRVLAIRFLKGESRQALEEAVERFYMQVLKPLEIKQVQDLIRQWQAAACSLVLVSATLDVIAECIARHMGIDAVVATKLAYSDGICLGKMASDLLRNKLSHLKSLKCLPPYEAIITDNRSDLSLVLRSKRAFLVVDATSRPFWEKRLKHHPSVVYIDNLSS